VNFRQADGHPCAFARAGIDADNSSCVLDDPSHRCQPHLGAALVVKNGSKIREAVWESMPCPVSLAANSNIRVLLPTASNSRKRISRRKLPPRGMASRALRARLRMICCACAKLTPTKPESSARSAIIRMFSPSRCLSSGSSYHTTRLKQIARGAELSSRPIVINCRTRVAP
jgi:hypothetical protein